jgi:hypothetical protein
MAELCAVHFYSPLQFCSEKPKSQAKFLRNKAPGENYFPMRDFFDERSMADLLLSSIANLFILEIK